VLTNTPRGGRQAARNVAIKTLLQPEARLRAIFETSDRYQCVVAPGGKLLDANPAFLRGIGAQPDEVAGKPFWDTPWCTGTPGMREIVKAGIADAAQGRTFRAEVPVALPAGLRRFDFTLRPICSTWGDIAAIIAEAADITESRQAWEALRQNQELETIAALTGGIAHDFNNLLTPIVGGLDLIQRRLPAGEKTSRLISGAMQSAGRASLLVQHLLAFARRQHFDARVAHVRRLVEGTSDLIGRLLGPGIEIRVELVENLPAAKADPDRLELALYNLVVNARDAMPRGGTLFISAKAVTVSAGGSGGLAPGLYVCLSVADTGAGMSPETLALAIEPSLSMKEDSKAIGLPMVHRLAAQSGGQLTLESSRGAGTKATLWLPAADFVPRLASVRIQGAS